MKVKREGGIMDGVYVSEHILKDYRENFKWLGVGDQMKVWTVDKTWESFAYNLLLKLSHRWGHLEREFKL